MNNSDVGVIVDNCIKDEVFRRELVKSSLYWFMHIYFPDYLTFPLAPFHKEIVQLLESDSPTIAISAFRGSGKSTIVSLAYVIWSMVGIKNKRFILLVSNTARQAEMLMFNIKNVLESHPLLKSDLGPFQETSEEWNIGSLVFKDHDAKIMAISVNESIRGIKYKNKRPDLIVCDDVETLDSVRTSDNREKLQLWFDRDIIPIGDESTTIVIVGTIMTYGSLMQTIMARMETHQLLGSFRKYPIINEKGNILWQERWSSIAEIEEFRKQKGILPRTWETEFMLNDWIEEDQLVKPEHILYYDDLPLGIYPSFTGYIAVDLAISKEANADKTAILQAYMFDIKGVKKLYILPDPLNKRLNFHESIVAIERTADLMFHGRNTYIIVETNGYQRAVAETLIDEGYLNTKLYGAYSDDKYGRLESTLHNLSLGNIYFPRKGCEVLIDQLLRFGYERYDDMADAFSMLVHKSFELGSKMNGPLVIKSVNFRPNILSSG